MEVNTMNDEYLSALFGKADVGFISVWEGNSKKTTWFPVANASEAAAFMRDRAPSGNVYFGWTLQKETSASGRSTGANSCCLMGVFLDVDLRAEQEGIHSNNEQLPTSWEPVRAHLVELGLPEPTAVRHSGNGVYLDWLFEEPWMFASEAERIVAQKFSQSMQKLAIAACSQIGSKLDNVGDFARITRMPGTLNHKTSPAKAVQLLELREDRRIDRESLQRIVAELSAQLLPSAPTNYIAARIAAVAASSRDSDRAAGDMRFQSVANGCKWVAASIERSARLPEPEWHALAGIAGRCEGGSDIFHDLSRTDARYDPNETQGKLDRALSEAGPRRCDTIETDFGFGGCRSCPFKGHSSVGSPLSLGREQPWIAELMARYAYDLTTGRYVNIQSKAAYQDKIFSNMYRHLSGRTIPHTALVSNRLTAKVAQTDYLAGNDRAFVEAPNSRILNVWSPSELVPDQGGSCDLVLQHIAHVYPDPEARNHVLDCWASVTQRPADKLRHVLLTIGKQGVGKSFFAALSQRLFGRQNTYVVESSLLRQSFNAQFGNRQCLVLEELDVSDRRDIYETLKRWITDETVTVNEKNVPHYEARTPKLMLAFSNHDYPIHLGAGDRRFWIYRSPADRADAAYYARLFTDGLGQAGAFLALLLKRDISQFSPDAAPPMTEAKRAVHQRSKPALERELEAMIEEGAAPFAADLFTFDALFNRVVERMPGRMRPSTREVQEALRALGGINLDRQVRLTPDSRVRLWAVKDVDKWAAASADEIRQSKLIY
jgi:hypothetical protein